MKCQDCGREISPAESECPICRVPLARRVETMNSYVNSKDEEIIVRAPGSIGGQLFEGSEAIEMKANRKYMNKDCPVCLKTIYFGDDIKVCANCDIPYHKDCFPPDGCRSETCKGGFGTGGGRRALAPDEKFCPMCGQPIKKVAIKCKHCGAPVDQQYKQQQAQQKPINEKAGKNSIIFGILAIVFSIIPLLGVVFSILAIKNGKEAKMDEIQASSGNTGHILGIIGLVLSIIVFILSFISNLAGAA